MNAKPRLGDLAGMCEALRDEIIAAWNRQVRELPEFADVPEAETLENVSRCFEGFFARLSRNDDGPLTAFLEDLARRRFATGFDIHVPLTAAARFRTAIREVYWRHHGEIEVFDALSEMETVSRAVDAEIDAFNGGFSAAFARLLVEESETRLRELFDDSFDVLMRLDPEGRIVEMNARFDKLFGFSAERWRGRPWADLLAGGRERANPLLERIFRGDSVHSEFVDIRDARGNVLRCSMTGHRSRAASAREAIVVLRDVSEEEALRAQVIQGEKLASIGQLSATVAHELNNPLAWVLNNLEQIQSVLKDPTMLEKHPELLDQAVADALEGTERMTDILADLRDYARTERGQIDRFEMDDVIELALRICDAQIGHRTAIRREYHPTPPVSGRPGRLSQVFVNLFVNAVQAMGGDTPGDNELVIGTSHDERRVYIDVRDNGPGIPPEHRNSVFAPFVSTKGSDGTGLGLWVCRNIIAEHGGELVLVDSERGAHFRISLPIANGGR